MLKCGSERAGAVLLASPAPGGLNSSPYRVLGGVAGLLAPRRTRVRPSLRTGILLGPFYVLIAVPIASRSSSRSIDVVVRNIDPA